MNITELQNDLKILNAVWIVITNNGRVSNEQEQMYFSTCEKIKELLLNAGKK
ncbi:MAG: hypothetical protein ACP6IY_22670 [Promethearchaeia archaeon]